MLKHYALDILQATEAAAAASVPYVGRGDKIAADRAATDAMRRVLSAIPGFSARVAIGEGKKDNAPGIFAGEAIGDGHPQWAIAVDPLDGTTQAAKGGPGAMSVIAVAEQMLETECHYMLKAAFGRRMAKAMFEADVQSLLAPGIDLPLALATIRSELPGAAACLLDRPRHAGVIAAFHEAGWRVILVPDGDVAAAIATALPAECGAAPLADLYYGIGGAPEGVIAAAAMKCLGGFFHGVLVEGDELTTPVMNQDELARGEAIFCATGVTSGHMLRGAAGSCLHSMLLYSKSARVRMINSPISGL